MNKRLAQIMLFAGTVFTLSCNNTASKNHGPIVLGDSSTIVTEEDPQKLRDLVADLKPVIPPAEKDSTEENTKPAEAKPDSDKDPKPTVATPPPAQVLPSGPGMKAEFKEVSVAIPGLTVKQAGKANLQNANGAVYTLVSGNINGSQLHTTGNVLKVSQRYQSVIQLKYDGGMLPVESLNTTTSWAPLKGGKNLYYISGLDAGSLQYPDDEDENSIRNAVTRSAQRHRMSKKKIQDLVSGLRHVRSANQKPLVVSLRSVIWKIDGKDTQGRPFSKQIRIDIPM